MGADLKKEPSVNLLVVVNSGGEKNEGVGDIGNRILIVKQKHRKKYFSKISPLTSTPKIQSRETMSIPKSGVRSIALGPLTSSSFEIGFWRQKFQKTS